ncbi:M81 family metallopeptidase [Humibacter ginsengiterrae]
MRVGLLGLWHEANTFTTPLLDRSDLARFGILVGEEIVHRFRDGTATMSGFLDVAENDVELIPLRTVMCIPGPPIAAEAFKAEVDAMCECLASAGRLDVVLAMQHGACVAEGCLDADGYMLARYRDIVGSGTVLATGLDLHANVSDLMLDSVDLLNAYQTNPHVDPRQQGRRIAELAIATARHEVRPTIGCTTIPAVPNILQQNTGMEPMRSIVAAAERVQKREGVLSAVVTEGYPYADVPEMGMRAIVITNGDQDAAQRYADELAEFVWAQRELLSATAPDTDAAMTSLPPRTDEGPTLVLDVGDNIGAGSAGDSVVLLHAARRLDIRRLAAIVVDPMAVTRCNAVEPGTSFELTFGGWSDPSVGPPLTAQVAVLARHDGRFTATGPVHAGLEHHEAGPSVLIRLDTEQLVLLTSDAVMPVTPVQLQIAGVDLEALDVVIAKGVHSPLAGYGPVTGECVAVDTPGASAASLDRLTYRHRRVPMLPFEPETAAPAYHHRLP